MVDAGTTTVKAALLEPGGAALATAALEQASALGMPVPAPLADTVDPATVVHPGGQREHYDRLADAHGELWALLRPTFRALAGR